MCVGCPIIIWSPKTHFKTKCFFFFFHLSLQKTIFCCPLPKPNWNQPGTKYCLCCKCGRVNHRWHLKRARRHEGYWIPTKVIDFMHIMIMWCSNDHAQSVFRKMSHVTHIGCPIIGRSCIRIPLSHYGWELKNWRAKLACALRKAGRGGIYSLPCQLEQHWSIMGIWAHVYGRWWRAPSAECVTPPSGVACTSVWKDVVGWLYMPLKKHTLVFAHPGWRCITGNLMDGNWTRLN